MQHCKQHILTYLIRFLLNKKAELVEQWSGAVLNKLKLKATETAYYNALSEQILDLLELCWQDLPVTNLEIGLTQFPRELPAVLDHGKLRAQQEHELSELINEFGQLRNLLLETVGLFQQQHAELTKPLELMLVKSINQVIDYAIAQAVSQFTKARELTKRNEMEQFKVAEDLRRLTEQLERQDNFINMLANITNEGICEIDLQANVTRLNPVAETMLGWRQAELLGQNIYEVLHFQHADSNNSLCPLLTVLHAGNSFHHHREVLTTKNGQTVPIICSAAPLVVAGQTAGAVIVFQDISERQQSEQVMVERTRLANLGASIGITLIQSDSLPEMLRNCAENLVQHLDAALARCWTFNEKEQLLELQGSAGIYNQLDGPYSRVPIGQYNIGCIAQQRQSRLCNDIQHEPDSFDQVWTRKHGLVAFAGCPLTMEDRLIGVMAVFSRQPLSETSLQTMQSVANGIALGIERVRTQTTLREVNNRLIVSSIREQAARAEAEANEQLARFLAESSNVLTSSLDYETSLKDMARLAVPVMADFCFFDIITSNQMIQRVAWAHAEPSKQQYFDNIWRFLPSLTLTEHPLCNALLSNSTQLISEATESWQQLAASCKQSLPDLTIHSLLVVPLSARERLLGALIFCLTDPNRHYSPADLRLAEELARRAALAIDNAQLYRESQLARGQAEEASRLKDEFLATVSHELRTPLTGILGWAQLLRSNKLDEAGRTHAIQAMERAAKAQAQLINDLLDVTRIISGKLYLEIESIDLYSVIEVAIDTIRPTAAAKDIQISLSLNPGVNTVLGDADRLQQVILNLISNAIKFTPNGGHIEVQLVKAGHYVEIAISDSGQGISAEFLPHVFERFRQVDGSTTRRHGGLGLGLAIVRHLVELHGGFVRAFSPGLGLGSVFTINLPINISHQIERNRQLLSSSSIDNEFSCTSVPMLNGLRLLIVDDQADVRNLLSKLLSSFNINVRVASSARQALKILKEWLPDLLVSDIGMPVEDGYMLIRQVRALPPTQGGLIPALALTAFARNEDRHYALSAGYHAYLTKPIEPCELLNIIVSLISDN